MTTCSAHAQIPAGKPAAVSVNGVAIARDAIVREMQHHPAAKPIAAWQQAARALVIRELLLQRARHLGVDARTDQRRRGPARDRRRGDHAGAGRARGRRCRSRTTRPAGAITSATSARFRSPDIYEASHILFAALPADARGLCAGARRGRRRAGRVARAPGAVCRTRARRIRAVRRRHRAAISARSRRGRRRPNSSRRCSRSNPASCAKRRSRRATASTSSGSIASMRAVRCPTKWSPTVSPTICARACGGAPTRNTSRGWCRRRSIEGIDLAGADALRVH